MISPDPNIRTILEKYRQACERVWCEETASADPRPLAGKPISTGQCSATSIVLSRALADHIPAGLLKLAVGGVYDAATLEPLIPLHVWLLHYDNLFREPLVIDLTADQSRRIPHKVIYATPTTLIQQRLIYLPWNVMMAEEAKSGTLERARLLDELLRIKSF